MSTTVQWAGDRRRSGERRLDDQERRALERRVRGRRAQLERRRWLCRVIAGLCLVPGVAFLVLAPRVGETFAVRLFAAIAMVVIVGAVPALIFVPMWRTARRWLPVLVRAEAELGEGIVAVFELREGERDDDQAEPEIAARVEALPSSFLVTSVDGVAATGWEVLPVVEIAEAPATFEAPWPWPIPGLPEGMSVLQRHMSAAEQDELGRQARGIPGRAAGAGALTLFFAAHLVRLLGRGRGPELSGTGWLIAFAVAAVPVVALLRLRRLMRRDLAERRVAVLRHGDDLVELLPHTRRPWTLGGLPAPWRRRRF